MKLQEFRELFEKRNKLQEERDKKNFITGLGLAKQIRKIDKILEEACKDEEIFFSFNIYLLGLELQTYFLEKFDTDLNLNIKRSYRTASLELFVTIADNKPLFLATITDWTMEDAYVDLRNFLMPKYRSSESKKFFEYEGVEELLWNLIKERVNYKKKEKITLIQQMIDKNNQTLKELDSSNYIKRYELNKENTLKQAEIESIKNTLDEIECYYFV